MTYQMMCDPWVISKAVENRFKLKVQSSADIFNPENTLSNPKDASICALYAANANLKASETRDQDSIYTTSLSK